MSAMRPISIDSFSRSSAKPRAFVDEARDAGGVDGLQAVLFDDRGDQTGIGVIVLTRTGDGVVEIGLHLEQAREIGVVRGQQIVKLAIAEQNHPEIERGWARDRATGSR